MFQSLPEDCILRILSFMTPYDTCNFATLSSFFRSIAESDQVWRHFFPSNYEDMLSRADAPIPIHLSSKKDLFFYLCDPILIDGGKNVNCFLSIIIFYIFHFPWVLIRFCLMMFMHISTWLWLINRASHWIKPLVKYVTWFQQKNLPTIKTWNI